MTTPVQNPHPDEVPLYHTKAYPCSYLSEQQARSQIVLQSQRMSKDRYSQLVQNGFRRSGNITYRPACDHCQACIPVRIPVAQFQPTRSQRRSSKTHQNLLAQEQALRFSAHHYQLYQRYQRARHAGNGMDLDEPEQYRQSLLLSQIDTRLVEFSEHADEDEDEQLGQNTNPDARQHRAQQKHTPPRIVRMVSIIDVLNDGLSSVYTFFDPDYPGSLGTYNILWQIEQCRLHQLPYLYLGYWVEHSQKMAYKAKFQTIEGLIEGRWQTL
ncbi:MAG: arginyltransferase [Pseudomonadota bacterium]